MGMRLPRGAPSRPRKPASLTQPPSAPYRRPGAGQGMSLPPRAARGTIVRHYHVRKGILTNSSPTPEGPDSVSGAPHLPEGFTDTFTSRYIDTGDVRLHAVVGGDGPPLLLIHGWPGSWYYWRLVMPALAWDFEVIAVDQRGILLSDKPQEGYDTGTLANDLVGLMDALGHGQFAVVGVGTGLPIGYALAADHPDRVVRLAVGEAPLPGITPPTPLILPDQVVDRLWHVPFNQLKETNEKLVSGREDIFFGAEFSASAGTNKLPDYARPGDGRSGELRHGIRAEGSRHHAVSSQP
jgi:pimeloyl-ACP methyl ester carboxylesterase